MDMQNPRSVDAALEIEGVVLDEWDVVGAGVRERLNEPYQLTVDLFSERAGAEARPLLGKSVELVLSRRGVEERVAGIVTEVRDGRRAVEDGMRASLTVEPAFAALRHRQDTRIFQEMSGPQILEQVLGEDLSRFGREARLDLAGTYPAREFCVQYRESDLDFAMRIMEEEGIGYHFEHPGEKEVLTLFDRPQHHQDIAGEAGPLLTYDINSGERDAGSERVVEVEPLARMTGTKVTTLTFDWTHPTTPVVNVLEAQGAGPELESYVLDAPVTLHDYAGIYGANNSGQQAQLLRELQVRDANVVRGRSNSLAMRCGKKWQLNAHPRLDLNAEYVVVEVHHRLYAHDAKIDVEESEAWDYANQFTCLPAEVPWRPDRVRKRPQVLGVQTATVVGPEGEEIHTDPHGRVKVHFHWDRHGARNDADSCWLRVMQAMGGSGWGFTFVPRIGMEVVITFIDGDPDRPLVTGVVYNPANPPPIDLPADKTRTTIKTNSSPGGGGNNEFRLEDKAGMEEIFLHGQKDWNTIIENDLNRSVGNNEAQQVALNRTRTVGVDESISVGNNRDHIIGVDESISIGSNQTITIGTNQSTTIGNDHSRHVLANSTDSIDGSLTHTIKKNLMQTVMQGFQQTIMANHMANVIGNSETSIVLNEMRNIGINRTAKIGADDTLDVSGDWTVKVGGKVGIECGGASIVLEDGNVTIKGVDIVIEGSGNVVNKAGGDVALNGAKVKLNC